MVVCVNWLKLCQDFRRGVFWARYYSSCTLLNFSIQENMLIGYTEAVIPYPGVRVTVAVSLIRDLGMVSEWCDLWEMRLNASKTNTMIVSGSRTMHSHSPPPH